MDKRQRVVIVVAADVDLKNAYALSVNAGLDAKNELELFSGAAATITQSRKDKLGLSAHRSTCQWFWYSCADAVSGELDRQHCPFQTTSGSDLLFQGVPGTYVIRGKSNLNFWLLSRESWAKKQQRREKKPEKKKKIWPKNNNFLK